VPTRRDDDGRQLLTRRALCGALVVAALSVASLAAAQDAAGALRDLAESPDFRVRVSAALYLGRNKPPGSLDALVRALSDGHPTVRVASAAALGALGDPAAVGPLTRRLSSESSPSVAAQIHSAIDRLRQGVPSEQAPSDAGQRAFGPGVRYIVKLGAMRNPSGVRGEELRRVLREASLSRAHILKGGAVVDGDAEALARAAERHLPVITLDGSLTQVLESRVAGTVQVQARVEFAVRREQTLKGTLSGAATTFGSSPSITDQSRRQLQDDAVDGAVQSALRGADQGLIVASL
jgi:hypothetical protein